MRSITNGLNHQHIGFTVEFHFFLKFERRVLTFLPSVLSLLSFFFVCAGNCLIRQVVPIAPPPWKGTAKWVYFCTMAHLFWIQNPHNHLCRGRREIQQSVALPFYFTYKKGKRELINQRLTGPYQLLNKISQTHYLNQTQ